MEVPRLGPKGVLDRADLRRVVDEDRRLLASRTRRGEHLVDRDALGRDGALALARRCGDARLRGRGLEDHVAQRELVDHPSLDADLDQRGAERLLCGDQVAVVLRADLTLEVQRRVALDELAAVGDEARLAVLAPRERPGLSLAVRRRLGPEREPLGAAHRLGVEPLLQAEDVRIGRRAEAEVRPPLAILHRQDVAVVLLAGVDLGVELRGEGVGDDVRLLPVVEEGHGAARPLGERDRHDGAAHELLGGPLLTLLVPVVAPVPVLGARRGHRDLTLVVAVIHDVNSCVRTHARARFSFDAQPHRPKHLVQAPANRSRVPSYGLSSDDRPLV